MPIPTGYSRMAFFLRNPRARRPKSSQRLALRARTVLGCADGLENRQVARQLHITDQTVCKWRERFRRTRLGGLADEPRPGAPRKISDAQVEALITRTLESESAPATHWSTRSIAAASGMSQSTVSRIWRAFALSPHRVETFKLSTDLFFVEKVRDIVGQYLNPPQHALVLCVDEKSEIQALDRTRPILPLHQPRRTSHRVESRSAVVRFGRSDDSYIGPDPGRRNSCAVYDYHDVRNRVTRSGHRFGLVWRRR